MITTPYLSKLLFFDIETCGRYRNFEDLEREDPTLAEAWKSKATRMGAADPVSFYREKVALFPEYGRIACLSYGVHREGVTQIRSVTAENEQELMKKLYALFLKATNSDLIPTGWNIKNFDIPWLQRKFLMHGMEIPACVASFNRKPWEVNILDLKELWKGFSNLEVNFEEAVLSMGINTPKSDIDGSKVHSCYWAGEHDRIATYCEKDVQAMIELGIKIAKIYDRE